MNRLASKVLSTFCLTLAGASASYAGEKVYVTPDTVQSMSKSLYQMIKQDQFIPDLIVGISRGGLVPMGYLAGDGLFDMRNTLTISIQSYEKEKQGDLSLLLPLHIQDIQKFKSILIVDDIVDSGKTFEFVAKLFKDNLKDSTIKTSSLFYKPTRSSIRPDYYVQETDEWIVFPWE